MLLSGSPSPLQDGGRISRVTAANAPSTDKMSMMRTATLNTGRGRGGDEVSSMFNKYDIKFARSRALSLSCKTYIYIAMAQNYNNGSNLSTISSSTMHLIYVEGNGHYIINVIIIIIHFNCINHD